jgi:hypothetical protein
MPGKTPSRPRTPGKGSHAIRHDVVVTIDVTPQVAALVKRWLDQRDSAEVARFLYDQMTAQKANLDDNFLVRKL